MEKKIIIESHSSTIQRAQQLLDGCKDGAEVYFLVYRGQVELTDGKRAYGYYNLKAEYKFVGHTLQFDAPITYNGAYFKKRINGSFGIGSVVVLQVINNGQGFLLNSGIYIGTWYDDIEIASWEADAQKLNFKKLAMAKMKDMAFDERLKRALQGCKNVYKYSDNITRQYIVAKIINYLNS